jgi:hypothetical protein
MPVNLGQRAERVKVRRGGTSNGSVLERWRETKRRFYSKRSAEGICHDCGVKTDDGCRCQACRTVNAQRIAAIRAKSAANGLCSYCHKEPREPGITKCRPCADYCNQARARARQEKKVCECGHVMGNRAVSCVKCRYKHGK